MSPPKTSRAAWIAAALERHERGLLRYAAHLLGQADRARDAVQSTFLKLCGQDPARLEGRLAPWLFHVCRNEALDMRRGDRRLAPLPPATLAEQPSPEPTPARMLEARESMGGVLAVLATLPASQQEVLRLKFQEELSYRDIATVTGLTVNHVGVLIHNGLKALRARAQAEPEVGLRLSRRVR